MMKSMTSIVRLAALLLVITLGGCVLPGSIAVNTSADELLKKMGKPSEVRRTADGGEAWDYAYGPEGFATWRYTVDSKRVVRSVDQLLTEQRLYKVVLGESKEADVIEALGQPRRKMRLSNGVTWEWRVQLRPTPGVYIVTFDYQGVVRNVGIYMDESLSGDFP